MPRPRRFHRDLPGGRLTIIRTANGAFHIRVEEYRLPAADGTKKSAISFCDISEADAVELAGWLKHLAEKQS